MAELTLILRAKNMLAAGLSAAGGSVAAFGKTLRAVWAAAMGPIAVIIAAVMALRKAFEWVSETAGRYAKMLRTIQGDNEAAGIKRLTDSVKRLNAAHDESIAKDKRQAEISKIRIQALRAEEKANLDLAKAKAIAALDPADKEGRERVTKQFDEQAAQAAGQQKSADILAEQAAAQKELSKETARLADLRIKKETAFNAIVRANEAVHQTTQRMTGGFQTKSGAEARGKTLEGDQRRQQDAVENFRMISEDIKKAEEKIALGLVVVAEKGREAKAAQIEETARALSVETAAVIDNQEKITDLYKQAGDARVKIAEETAKQIADAETSRQEDILNAEKKRVEAKLAANDAIAKMTVAEFIDKQKGDKTEAERTKDEAARRKKLEDKVARGTRLKESDKEFLDAAKKIEAAKLQAEIDLGERIKLDLALKELRDKDSANLGEMKDSLKIIEDQLTPLLVAKGGA